MRVLLIEAAKNTGYEIAPMLNPKIFNLHHAHLGEEGLDLATLYDYNIIVLDLELPDIDGHQVLRTMRIKGVKTPVIIVSQPCDVEKKVMSLNLGADDHVIKPVYKDEMIARIHAVARRSFGHTENSIRVGHIIVWIDSKTVQVDGKNIHLPKKQYLLLETLFLNRGKVITREKLLSSLYHDEEDIDYRTIDVIVGQVRQKLGKDSVKTVPGFGYLVGETANT